MVGGMLYSASLYANENHAPPQFTEFEKTELRGQDYTEEEITKLEKQIFANRSHRELWEVNAEAYLNHILKMKYGEVLRILRGNEASSFCATCNHSDKRHGKFGFTKEEHVAFLKQKRENAANRLNQLDQNGENTYSKILAVLNINESEKDPVRALGHNYSIQILMAGVRAIGRTSETIAPDMIERVTAILETPIGNQSRHQREFVRGVLTTLSDWAYQKERMEELGLSLLDNKQYKTQGLEVLSRVGTEKSLIALKQRKTIIEDSAESEKFMLNQAIEQLEKRLSSSTKD